MTVEMALDGIVYAVGVFAGVVIILVAVFIAANTMNAVLDWLKRQG